MRCLGDARVAVAVDAREVDQPGTDDEELRSPYVDRGRARPRRLGPRRAASWRCPSSCSAGPTAPGSARSAANRSTTPRPAPTTTRASRTRAGRSCASSQVATIPRPDGRPEEANLLAAPRQAPRDPHRGEAAPERVPALSQPAPAASRLPGLRHLRRARGDRARDRRSRLGELCAPPGRRAADDNRRPRWPRAPSGAPRRSSPAPAPRPPTGSACGCSATRPSSRSSSGVDGVELVEAPDEITNDEDPVGAVRDTPEASIVLAAADVADGQLAGARQRRPDRGDDDRGPVRAPPHARRPPPGARRAARGARPRSARRACCSTSGANTEVRASRPGPVRLPGRRVQPARCSGSSARGWRCSRSARSRRRAPRRSSRRTPSSRRRTRSTSAATSRAATCSATRPTSSSPTGSPATSR